jgi:hypothetical protein
MQCTGSNADKSEMLMPSLRMEPASSTFINDTLLASLNRWLRMYEPHFHLHPPDL